jgi:hypothetical protein
MPTPPELPASHRGETPSEEQAGQHHMPPGAVAHGELHAVGQGQRVLPVPGSGGQVDVAEASAGLADGKAYNKGGVLLCLSSSLMSVLLSKDFAFILLVLGQ